MKINKLSILSGTLFILTVIEAILFYYVFELRCKTDTLVKGIPNNDFIVKKDSIFLELKIQDIPRIYVPFGIIPVDLIYSGIDIERNRLVFYENKEEKQYENVKLTEYSKKYLTNNYTALSQSHDTIKNELLLLQANIVLNYISENYCINFIDYYMVNISYCDDPKRRFKFIPNMTYPELEKIKEDFRVIGIYDYYVLIELL